MNKCFFNEWMNEWQAKETGLYCCLSTYKNVDKRENSGNRARGLGLALTFLSGKPRDGIAATAIHGPWRQRDTQGDGPPIKACPCAVGSHPRVPSSDQCALIDGPKIQDSLYLQPVIPSQSLAQLLWLPFYQSKNFLFCGPNGIINMFYIFWIRKALFNSFWYFLITLTNCKIQRVTKSKKITVFDAVCFYFLILLYCTERLGLVM